MLRDHEMRKGSGVRAGPAGRQPAGSLREALVFAFTCRTEALQMPLSPPFLGIWHLDSLVKACHLQARACRGCWTEKRSRLLQQGWFPSLAAPTPGMLPTGV